MRPKARILVVDDDPLVRKSFERVLAERWNVELVATGRDALARLAEECFDLALVDLKLPDIDGMDILRGAPDAFPDVPIIMITGYSTVSSAVAAIKAGAFDYVPKPCSPDELQAAVERALRERRLLRDCRRLQEDLADRYRVSRLVGESAPMKRVLCLVQQVAPTDTTVLITGESGTGKELVARATHFASPRKDRRFVAVDCGAIAPSLIASEIFGHVRGAFTGATADHEGLLQAADGGTFFLDEISNLPLDLQPALLRTIEQREVRPVGAADAASVDARFIAATNRDLKQLVAEGKFREDLYYRLNVFPIDLPPLRKRRDDIPLLARHFLAVLSAKMHKRIDEFTPEAMDALARYDWPGNVRELYNVVERLVILCPADRIGRAHLAESLPAAAPDQPQPRTVDELNDLKRSLREQAVLDAERVFLLAALRRSDYNVTKAADDTGMQRSNFQALLRKHNLRLKDLAHRGDDD